MAFLGEYEVSVTAGSRIVLPKKIRENLKGNTFILTKGYDICLAGYDKQDWNNRAGELTKISLLETDNVSKRRFLFSGACEIEIDVQGRFVIPKALFGYINLIRSTLTIIGVGYHFEIWETKSWQGYLKQINQQVTSN